MRVKFLKIYIFFQKEYVVPFFLVIGNICEILDIFELIILYQCTHYLNEFVHLTTLLEL